MTVDKSKQGFLFPGDNAAVEAALRAAGAQHLTRFDNRRHTWRDGVPLIRPGDTVFIFVMGRAPTKRGQDELPPSAQPREIVREIERRGAVLIEVYSGRSTAKKAEKEAIIRDASSALKGKGRQQMPPGFTKSGRRKVEFTAAQWEQAENAWCDTVKYPSWAFAASHLPEGFDPSRAYRQWGSREKANRDWMRRKAKAR